MNDFFFKRYSIGNLAKVLSWAMCCGGEITRPPWKWFTPELVITGRSQESEIPGRFDPCWPALSLSFYFLQSACSFGTLWVKEMVWFSCLCRLQDSYWDLILECPKVGPSGLIKDGATTVQEIGNLIRDAGNSLGPFCSSVSFAVWGQLDGTMHE